MEDHKVNFSSAEILQYKKLISDRFVNNPRMSLLFNKDKKDFKKNVFNLVDYCFSLALKLNGVFVAKNKKTIVLFYEHKKLKKSFADYYRYFKVIKGIPIFNIKNVLNNEKEIKDNQIKLNNYLYVWFIAQEEGYGKLDGLIEINKMLLKLSDKIKLPIIFETSDSRLIKFYERAGFKVYKKLKKGENTIYFLSDREYSE